MNLDWQTFLAQFGAEFEDGSVKHFGDAQAELAASASGSVIADLSHFGLIHFSGEDAGDFLHNQLSCDVKQLAQNSSVYGSYCSPKGRMLVTFLLWRIGAGYTMALPRSLQAAIQKRLGMFVLRSKVKLVDVTNEVVLLGMAGKAFPAALSAIFSQVPGQDHQGFHDERGLLLGLPLARWLWIGNAQAARELWPTLAAHAKPVGSPAWQWLDIQAGVPWIMPATQEQFVPQMTNLELIGGVSFQKGCYPGQEIVARTQYLGKLKRRMYLASAQTDTLPAPGTILYSENLGDQASGMVVNAQASPRGGYDLLAVAQVGSVEASTVRLGSSQGPALYFQPLPYSVT